MIISDKVVDKIKTHILCSVTVSENHAVYKTMSKKYGGTKPAKDTLWHIRVGCWISKVTRARIRTLTRLGTHTKARAHARTPVQPRMCYCFPRQH